MLEDIHSGAGYATTRAVVDRKTPRAATVRRYSAHPIKMPGQSTTTALCHIRNSTYSRLTR